MNPSNKYEPYDNSLRHSFRKTDAESQNHLTGGLAKLTGKEKAV